MRPLPPSAQLAVLVTMITVGCTVPAAPPPAANPTVEALNAQLASLSRQLEQIQPTAGAVETFVAPIAIPTVMPTVAPTDEPTPTAEVDPTAAPEPTQRIFPTRTPRPILASDAEPCRLGQVKGNRNSKIYHVPGGGSYSQTKANVECFDTEAAAQAAGYRRARN